jgi:hypothetical protein
VHLRLISFTAEGYRNMEDFLLPLSLSISRRASAGRWLARAGELDSASPVDLDVYLDGPGVPAGAFTFDPREPDRLVTEVLAEREDLGLALARVFPSFRREVTRRVIYTVAKENALFSLMTAMPGIAPGVALPWAVPEAVSDTTVLTVNQIRMAFLLAAASDRPVGYTEQKAEIASIIAGAFGWRAIARQLVSKVPFGGGLIPKAGVAFAATYIEGLSLERLYRLGYGFTRAERREAYGDALERGKRVATGIIEYLRSRRAS